MSNTDVDLSIIIVTYNSLPAIVNCLDCLKDINDSASSEVLVVDNNSSDGTAAQVQAHGIRPVVIAAHLNRGFAGGCNLGAARAKGECLLFLNPDVEVDNGALDELVSFCRAHTRAALVTPRLRHPDGSFQANCRRFPNLSNLLAARGSFLSRILGDSERYTVGDAAELLEVEAVAATMVACRRELFQELGGYDERFFMYMEDTDLSYRAHQAGYHNYFLPRAGAMHSWAKGSQAGRVRRLYYHHRSVWKYFGKHFPGVVSMIMLAPMLVVNFLVTAAFGARRSGK